MEGANIVRAAGRPYSTYQQERKVPWVVEKRFYLVQRCLKTGAELQRLGPFDTDVDAERHLATMLQERSKDS